MMPLRWFSTEKPPSVPHKAFLWAHLLVLRNCRSSEDSYHYSQNRSLIYLHLGGWLRWGPRLPCQMNGAQKTSILRLMIGMFDDRPFPEGRRDAPKERLFMVQRETLLWKTALETSLHKLQMVRSSMRERCIAQQTISLENCADRLPTCGVETQK